MLPVWLTDTFTPNLDRALHYTLQWGLEGVVLRTVGGHGDRVPHVNEARLKRRLAEYDLPVVAIDPGLFEGRSDERGVWMNDLVLLGEAAAFANRIGCRCILVGALPGPMDEAAEVLRRAGDLAAKHTCVLAVRNETEGRATRDLADVLTTVDHSAVRAAWSPADAQDAAAPVAERLRALAHRTEIVLLRDDGPSAWPEVLRALHATSFDGPVCLDLRAAETATDGLRSATALVRAIRHARRG